MLEQQPDQLAHRLFVAGTHFDEFSGRLQRARIVPESQTDCPDRTQDRDVRVAELLQPQQKPQSLFVRRDVVRARPPRPVGRAFGEKAQRARMIRFDLRGAGGGTLGLFRAAQPVKHPGGLRMDRGRIRLQLQRGLNLLRRFAQLALARRYGGAHQVRVGFSAGFPFRGAFVVFFGGAGRAAQHGGQRAGGGQQGPSSSNRLHGTPKLRSPDGPVPPTGREPC